MPVKYSEIEEYTGKLLSLLGDINLSKLNAVLRERFQMQNIFSFSVAFVIKNRFKLKTFLSDIFKLYCFCVDRWIFLTVHLATLIDSIYTDFILFSFSLKEREFTIPSNILRQVIVQHLTDSLLLRR